MQPGFERAINNAPQMATLQSAMLENPGIESSAMQILQSRFMQLQAGPDVLLRGHTGLISMDPQLRLHRELPLATFDRGELRPQ